MGLLEILKGEQPGIIRTLLNYENAGQFGEYSTEFALTNHNLKGHFAVLKNVYVPMKGKTTEIDLLMIHEKGIFVFESKNYSGWILRGHGAVKLDTVSAEWPEKQVLQPRSSKSDPYQSACGIFGIAGVRLYILYCFLRTLCIEKSSGQYRERCHCKAAGYAETFACHAESLSRPVFGGGNSGNERSGSAFMQQVGRRKAAAY